jgi:hypothetical protein
MRYAINFSRDSRVRYAINLHILNSNNYCLIYVKITDKPTIYGIWSVTPSNSSYMSRSALHPLSYKAHGGTAWASRLISAQNIFVTAAGVDIGIKRFVYFMLFKITT